MTYNNNIKLLNKNNIQKSTNIIEGISYLDYSPIAVEIEGNHITNIKRLRDTDKYPFTWMSINPGAMK